MRRYRFLHLANNIAAPPHYPMRTAFQSISREYYEIDWTGIQAQSGNKHLENVIRENVTRNKPEVIFMQIQHDGILSDSLIQWMGKQSCLVSWTGDVRENHGWFERVGKHVDVTLFTNQTDVDRMRSKGYSSDYLQVGFDEQLYSPYGGADSKYRGIVFMGNNYLENMRFPLSLARYNMCKEMWQHFSQDKTRPMFNVYGSGWSTKSGINFYPLNPDEEATCYRSCEIGINMSHFDYSRYSSDRLLRIMGCGTFCLTKWFPDIEKDYEDNKHLVVWYTIQDLIDKSKFWMRKDNWHKRKQIARQGMAHVRDNCIWTIRAKELTHIIEQYI